MAKSIGSVTHKSDKFNLRLPDGMRERVAQEARRKGRSMNSELVSYIEAGLKGVETASLVESIKNIESDIADIKELLSKR
ncbi:MAG: Arc family DNA-binding protein [Candidimonas sp.]|nr:MAG: Arc family DNA-binding protein [Candidimonas sp.]TAM26898.1 MAG: Arc family DNA-binding protein [Candidimonas sp.]